MNLLRDCTTMCNHLLPKDTLITYAGTSINNNVQYVHFTSDDSGHVHYVLNTAWQGLVALEFRNADALRQQITGLG